MMSRNRPNNFQQRPDAVPAAPVADVQALLDQLEATHPADPFAGDMGDETIRDGRRVWLIDGTPDHVPVLAYWRQTRAMREGRWQPVGGWFIWRGSVPLGFEPAGWYDASEAMG